jgi:hypothetical protein
MNAALIRNTIAIIFLTTVLAACHDDDDDPVPLPGGGDGGGNGGGDGAFGVTEITADNAERVARSVLTILTGQEPVPPYCDIRDCVTEPAAVAATVPVNVRPAALTIDEQDCPEGGSRITTTEDSGSDQTEVGDSTTTEYFACGIGSGNLIDGTIAIEVTATSGDFPALPYSLTNKVTYTEYSITLPELTWLAGPFTQIYDGEIVQTSSFETGNDNLNESLLNVAFEYGDGRMIQFFDFMSESDSVFDATTFQEVFAYSGAFSHSDAGIDGELTISTPESLVRTTIDLDAASTGYESGRVRIADTAGHYVEVVVLDLINLQLEADIDGNAGVDVVQAVTWEDLFYGNLRAN